MFILRIILIACIPTREAAVQSHFAHITFAYAMSLLTPTNVDSLKELKISLTWFLCGSQENEWKSWLYLAQKSKKNAFKRCCIKGYSFQTPECFVITNNFLVKCALPIVGYEILELLLGYCNFTNGKSIFKCVVSVKLRLSSFHQLC